MSGFELIVGATALGMMNIILGAKLADGAKLRPRQVNYEPRFNQDAEPRPQPSFPGYGRGGSTTVIEQPRAPGRPEPPQGSSNQQGEMRPIDAPDLTKDYRGREPSTPMRPPPLTRPTTEAPPPSQRPPPEERTQPAVPPTSRPTTQPTTQPSAQPTTQPTAQPSAPPTVQPSASSTAPGSQQVPNPMGYSSQGDYMGGIVTHQYDIPRMYAPISMNRDALVEAAGISGYYGGNNEDLIKLAHASYVAEVQKYDVVFGN